MLANEIKPAGRRHRLAHVSPHLLLHVASTRSRRESSARNYYAMPNISTTLNVYTQAVSEQKRSAHSSVVQIVLPVKIGNEIKTTGHFGTFNAD